MKHRFYKPLSLAALVVGGAAASIFISRNFFDTVRRVSGQISTKFRAGDAAFVRTMSHLFGPALVPGNKVRLLRNGIETFPAMLEAIRSARFSITMENFVWTEGHITRQFAEALIERANAGVRVHLLQDALGCDNLHGGSMHDLKQSSVEVEIFRFFTPTRINYRTHRKLLIVDGETGFIGGTGISDKWDGDCDKPGHWRDMHYQMNGPVVAQAQQAFIENWTQTHGVVLHGDEYFPELKNAGEELCQIFKSSESDKSSSARVMLLFSIAAARERIQIANAYFIPDDFTIDAFIEARRRGVEIDIITPGPNIDRPIVRFVSRTRWERLLLAGVRIHEFQPTRFHCKYMIVDECWASVGSANFDNRSLRINDEANLNVLDRNFAKKHSEIFAEDLARTREITLDQWRRRPLSEKLIGTAASVFRNQL